VNRRAARVVGVATILIGGILLGSTGCGSVTAKKSDGGGTGGSNADSSTKMDLAADRSAEDARLDAPENHDASSAKDMRTADARTTDASSHGGSSGGGAAGGTGGGAGGSGGGVGGGGECRSNGDCMLYAGAGSGCCGICQAASDPAPPPVECLLACLTPLKTCGCVNTQCVGSKTQL
jgi:hypothetical protein